MRQQPQQLPIPFELSAEDARRQTARKNLEDLGIKDPALVKHILSTETVLVELFAFMYKYKTGKIKATSNAGGLFLKICGLAGNKRPGA